MRDEKYVKFHCFFSNQRCDFINGISVGPIDTILFGEITIDPIPGELACGVLTSSVSIDCDLFVRLFISPLQQHTLGLINSLFCDV